MTATDLLSMLECVRSRGTGGWSAKCPAHSDHSPSLSITEGKKGVLLKCWAGCTLKEITARLGISVKDLFFDCDIPIKAERRLAFHQRAQERAVQQANRESQGRHMDALREAEYLVRSAEGITITRWSDAELDSALDRLSNAYSLLESEGRYE
jgi:hypothetical protein